MYPSSTLCREQETLQRARAASASLDNVRIVAERAASAWNIEAIAAEKREARHQRTRAIAAQQASDSQSQREFNGLNGAADRAPLDE